MKHTRFMHRLKRSVPTKEQIYDFVFDDASPKEIITSLGTVALFSLPGFYIAYEVAKPIYFGGTIEYRYHGSHQSHQTKQRKSEEEKKALEAAKKSFEAYVKQLDTQIASGKIEMKELLTVPSSLLSLLPRQPYTYSIDALYSSIKRTDNKTYSMYQYQALLQGYKYFDYVKQGKFGDARRLYNNSKLTLHMPFKTSDQMSEAQSVIKRLSSMYQEYHNKEYLKARLSLHAAKQELTQSDLLKKYTTPFKRYISSIENKVYHQAQRKATLQDNAIYQIYRIINRSSPPTQKDFDALHRYVTIVPNTYLKPNDYYDDIQSYLKKHNLKHTLQLCASKRFDEYCKSTRYKHAIAAGFQLLQTYHTALPLHMNQTYDLSHYDGFSRALHLVNNHHKKKFHIKLGKALYKEAQTVYNQYTTPKQLSNKQLQYVANLLEVANECYNKFSTLQKSQQHIEKNLLAINIRLLARYVQERKMDDNVLKTYHIVQSQKSIITSAKHKNYVSSLLNKFNNVYALTYVTK